MCARAVAVTALRAGLKVCEFVCIYIYIYMYTHICIRESGYQPDTYVCVCLGMCVCVRACVCVCSGRQRPED